MPQDIRWRQRLQNFSRAMATMDRAMLITQERTLTELEQQGLIKGFEFSHELAWNVLKDYLDYQGIADLVGSRDATRTAFQNGLIQDGEVWMEMIKDRNLSSHIYLADVASAIVADIQSRFYPALQMLLEKMETIRVKMESQ
jgi:nucleotidyltransferase substrate binding protein (TIGR01987 family)